MKQLSLTKIGSIQPRLMITVGLMTAVVFSFSLSVGRQSASQASTLALGESSACPPECTIVSSSIESSPVDPTPSDTSTPSSAPSASITPASSSETSTSEPLIAPNDPAVTTGSNSGQSPSTSGSNTTTTTGPTAAAGSTSNSATIQSSSASNNDTNATSKPGASKSPSRNFGGADSQSPAITGTDPASPLSEDQIVEQPRPVTEETLVKLAKDSSTANLVFAQFYGLVKEGKLSPKALHKFLVVANQMPRRPTLASSGNIVVYIVNLTGHFLVEKPFKVN